MKYREMLLKKELVLDFDPIALRGYVKPDKVRQT